MGYRSDVAYVIKFEDADSLKAFKTAIRLEKNDLREALHDCETIEDEDVIRYHVESIKWYPDYPEVKAHIRLIRLACDEPFNAGARLVRIGEEDDDIEVEDYGNDEVQAYDLLEVQRRIAFN